MRVRTFFMILVLLGVLWGIAAMWTANRDVLRQPVVLWGDSSTTVAWLLVAFLATGVIGTIALGGAREFSLMIERSRLRKAGRKYEEIEEEYSRGLVAVVEGRDDEALAHAMQLIDDAVAHGARQLCGGRRVEAGAGAAASTAKPGCTRQIRDVISANSSFNVSTFLTNRSRRAVASRRSRNSAFSCLRIAMSC